MRPRLADRAFVSGAAALGFPALAAAAEPSSAALPLTKLLLGLGAVVAAVLLFSRMLSRFSFVPTGDSRFRVVASLPVGQRERVVLMQVGERQIVVGVAPGRVDALHVLDEPLELGRTEAVAHGAAPWLARVLSGRSQ